MPSLRDFSILPSSPMSLVFCFLYINEPAYRQAGLFSPRACNVKFGLIRQAQCRLIRQAQCRLFRQVAGQCRLLIFPVVVKELLAVIFSRKVCKGKIAEAAKLVLFVQLSVKLGWGF